MYTPIKLNTIAEIKAAVDQGKSVYAGSLNYEVVRDGQGEYWIKSQGHRIGLHGEGEYSEQLNGSDFFALEKMEGRQ